MSQQTYLVNIRNQKSEIEQVSGSRQTTNSKVCQMQTTKFLLHATYSMLNSFGGGLL